MRTAEFVEVYPDHVSEARRQAGPFQEELGPAREWSYQFGLLLHDHLKHPEADLSDSAFDLHNRYNEWGTSWIRPISGFLWAQAANAHPDALKALTELNYHHLQAATLSVWPAMFERYPGEILSPQARRQALNYSQNCIALQGLHMYVDRLRISGIKTDYLYFSDKNLELRNRAEGMLTEYDTAIISLEIMKRHPSVNFTPAPAQFEHMSARGATPANADFIGVNNASGQAIGIQSKSNVKAETAALYDKDRIVLVDGKVDFANTLAKRITPGSSRVSHVGWAGLICAHRILDLPSKGPDAATLFNLGIKPQYLQQQKALARQVLGDIQPHLKQATDIINGRVMRKLIEEPTAA